MFKKLSFLSNNPRVQSFFVAAVVVKFLFHKILGFDKKEGDNGRFVEPFLKILSILKEKKNFLANALF